MRIPLSTLRRRLGLPADATEATIRAAIAAGPPARKPQAPLPAGPQPSGFSNGYATRDVAQSIDQFRTAIHASTDAQIAAAAASPSASAAERQVIVEEQEHRVLMAARYPRDARELGYAPHRLDLAARQGSPTKGPTEAG